ncbi:MAG: deaminase [Proteobacteria bacterium]|nr:deaminase [Pseudomonadota bacterium]
MNEENIKKHLARCYELAAGSPDRSNQNGAIIVGNITIIGKDYADTPLDDRWEILSEGRNEFPSQITVTEDMITDREKKLFYIEHAERNALFSLARRRSTEGLTMICQWLACSDCARAIALMGIKKVIGHKERMDMTPDRWKASVDAGLQLLRDCGVELEFYSGKIGCNPILVNGELWYP